MLVPLRDKRVQSLARDRPERRAERVTHQGRITMHFRKSAAVALAATAATVGAMTVSTTAAHAAAKPARTTWSRST